MFSFKAVILNFQYLHIYCVARQKSLGISSAKYTNTRVHKLVFIYERKFMSSI